jgi:pimeloyl-ACP methyl ester carboxylesterase
MPRTSVHIAEELRTALHHAGIGGPYILVGSAFGGDNVRTFADLYMDQVAGLVLDNADPTPSDAKQIFTHNSSEYIQFDEPETLINAVREVYDQARRPVAGHSD